MQQYHASQSEKSDGSGYDIGEMDDLKKGLCELALKHRELTMTQRYK